MPTHEPPRYRFHGRIPPEPDRQPIRAELQATDGGDGVATVRLYDPIDSWGGDWGVSAKEFATVLDGLDDSIGEIRLHINSPGGEVFEGIAIMNLLRDHRAKVTAVVDGIAASAASFLAASADETVMGRNAELMIHDAWGLGIGNAADMRDLAERLDHLSNNIAAVYAAKAGGSTADWRAHMVAETWYSADEAITAGLADRLNEKADAPKDRFDLSIFQHAGRADAPAPTPTAPAELEPTGMSAKTRLRHRLNRGKAA